MSPQLQTLLANSLSPPLEGKVRDSYRLHATEKLRPLRLSVKTGRWSIFDFKLGFPNPGQAEALNAFDIAAKLYLKKKMPRLENDLVGYGPRMDPFLPEELRGNTELMQVATVIEEVDMYPVEFVARNRSTGTFHKAYLAAKGGAVWGHAGIPPDQPEGFELPRPIYTPTTKAQVGHDIPHDYLWACNIYGPELQMVTLEILAHLTELSARGGVIGVDTKIEIGRRKLLSAQLSVNRMARGKLVLADEVWTPHSSRFWPEKEFDACYPARLPVSMDKQIGRKWGISVGIDKLNPENPHDVEKVLAMRAPPEVMELMHARAHRAFKMVHGLSIPEFQKTVMHIH
jgi:phosphoribosylaminoimidazole-succinocarboxamide synthase